MRLGAEVDIYVVVNISEVTVPEKSTAYLNTSFESPGGSMDIEYLFVDPSK